MMNETRFKGLGPDEEKGRLAPLIMLSSPNTHEPISITVNDADGQSLKIPGEDSDLDFFNVLSGASPISSHAPSASPMSAGWVGGAFREPPGSPNSPYSDPPSPFSGYGLVSGASSPYPEQSPDSSHNSSPIASRFNAMELTGETFDFPSAMLSQTSSDNAASSSMNLTRGRSSSRSTDSLHARRDISQLGIPDIQPLDPNYGEDSFMSELFNQSAAPQEVFGEWQEPNHPRQPSLSIDVGPPPYATQDTRAMHPQHRRGLSASSHDPFISGYTPSPHTSSSSGEGALEFSNLLSECPSPVPSEPHLSASLSSRRSSYSDTHNGHSVAAANRGRSHSRTSSSASSSRRPSPYARPDANFLSVPEPTHLQRRHSLHGHGRARPFEDRPLSDQQSTLQRVHSAPVPRSREPSPSRPTHRPTVSADQYTNGLHPFVCDASYVPPPSFDPAQTSPLLLPVTIAPSELHSQAPVRYGHRPSVSEDIRASGSSTLAPPTTVSPQDLFIREPTARMGHRISMSEDRRFSGTSSLAPPDPLAGREPSPYLESPPAPPPVVDEPHSAEPEIVKRRVASAAILQASGGRRKKSAEFRCEWQDCTATFTAKHNLTNHMNSHLGIKPHKCKHCGNGFTTSGTARRHENQCSKNPEKQAGPSTAS